MSNPNEPYHQPKNDGEKLDELIIITKEIGHRVDFLIRKVIHMATQLEHLQAAFAKLAADVDVAVAEIKDLSQKLNDAIANGIDKAAVEAVATGLDDLAGRLEAVAPPASVAPTQ